jgi:hypothetical protein
MISKPLLARVQDQIVASLQAAQAASNQASELIATHPEIDGTRLATAIGHFLDSQSQLFEAVQRLQPPEPLSPPTTCRDDTVALDLSDERGEPHNEPEGTRR